MIRVRRNCYSEKDYNEKSNVLIECFVREGCKRHKLEEIKKEVGRIKVEKLLIVTWQYYSVVSF